MIDKQTIYQYIFGNSTLEFYISFYIFVVIGLILSMLLHLRGKKNRDAKQGKNFKFNIKYWLKDNFNRFVTNIIVVFILIRFYDELKEATNVQYELNMFLGFVAGTSLDRVIMFIRNKTGINAFQTKNK